MTLLFYPLNLKFSSQVAWKNIFSKLDNHYTAAEKKRKCFINKTSKTKSPFDVYREDYVSPIFLIFKK